MVPGATEITARDGPLLVTSGSPVEESVEATLAPLVMEPAEVMMRPVTVIAGADVPLATLAPE
jgi:hypothetical protein